MDVKALYTNIPNNQGIAAVKLKVIKNKKFLGEIYDNLFKQLTGIKFIQYR